MRPGCDAMPPYRLRPNSLPRHKLRGRETHVKTLITGVTLATLSPETRFHADRCAGLFPRQDHQHRGVSALATATTSIRGCSLSTWAATSPAIRASSCRTCPAPARCAPPTSSRKVAPKDGTYFGSVGGGTATAGLLDAKNARFDARRFGWIGSMNSEVGLVLSWGHDAVQDHQGRDEAGVHCRRRRADVGQRGVPDRAQPGGRHPLQGGRRLQGHRRHRARGRARRAATAPRAITTLDHRPQPGLADQASR